MYFLWYVVLYNQVCSCSGLVRGDIKSRPSASYISRKCTSKGYESDISGTTLEKSVLKTTRFLEELSDLTADMIDKGLKKSPTEKLIRKPGFAFGLGCHEWKSCGYNGKVQSWNSDRSVDWFSSSLLQLDSTLTNANDVTECNSVEANLEDIKYPLSLAALNIILISGSSTDIPHFKLNFEDIQMSKSGKKVMRVNIDFIPRVDIINNLEYYDKYFCKLDVDDDVVAQTNGIIRLPAAQSIITRMLTSAFSIDVEFSDTDTDTNTNTEDFVAKIMSNNTTANANKAQYRREFSRREEEFSDTEERKQSIIKDMCQKHIGQWLDWLSLSNISIDQNSNIEIAHETRDKNIRQLLQKDYKYTIANNFFGANFAPKAEEIACAHYGPNN